MPALRLIRAPADEVARRAEELRAALAGELAGRAELSLRAGQSVVGGGSTPGYSLPTRLLAVSPKGISPAELAARLRRADPPVIVRVEGERVLLDLRTVFEDQQPALVAGLRQALG